MATRGETDSASGPREVHVRTATAADGPTLTEMMARAFDDDPVVNWTVKQDARRVERIRALMRLGFERLSLPYGHAYTADETEGAALWVPPEEWKLGPLQQLRLLPSMVSLRGLAGMPGLARGMNAIEKRHPGEPHWYLLLLGVEPELQGRSVGGQLMAPILEVCDRERTPAYLENSKERNISFYERHGFRVTEQFEIPGGPPVWLMWRDPS